MGRAERQGDRGAAPPQEVEVLRQNPASKVVFLDGVWRTAARIFVQIPMEYGFDGPVGMRYDAIKDYLRWHNFKVKEWTPIFVRAGAIWAANIRRSRK